MFLEILFISSFTTGSAKFREFHIGSMVLFQIKVFERNIKQTSLAKYFIKVTACPSFSLRVIKQINRVH